MPDTPIPSAAEREETLGGVGCARKRKEDIRFIQGKGNYVDDIKLQGMLFGDFVRRPLWPCPRQIDRRQRRPGAARRGRGADGG